jgi:predicted permease
MGIRLLRGRGFTALDDAESAQHVAVVNETMATFWAGDRDPIGMTLAFKGNPKDQITIVGVVEDTYQMNLREAPPRTVYTPVAKSEQPPSGLTLELRTAGNPAAIVAAVRESVRGVNRSIVIRYVRTIDQQIDASLVRERLLATLSASFALLALVLSAIGLYGVMSYTVTRRSREIGIRMALGAARGRVLGQVLSQTFAIAAAGTVAGIAGALMTTKALSTFLFGLSGRDPATIAGVALVLLVTSMIAGLLPARRAATLDPARAIRTE